MGNPLTITIDHSNPDQIVGGLFDGAISHPEAYSLPNHPPVTNETIHNVAAQLRGVLKGVLDLNSLIEQVTLQLNMRDNTGTISFHDLPPLKIDDFTAALHSAPIIIAPRVAARLYRFPKEKLESIARLLLELAPKQVAPIVAEGIYCLPKEKRESIARLLLESALEEVAPILAQKIRSWPKDLYDIAVLFIQLAPKKAAIAIVNDLKGLTGAYSDYYRYMIGLFLELAPREAAHLLEYHYPLRPPFDAGYLRRIIPPFLERAPEEVAPMLAEAIYYFPKQEQADIVRLFAQKAPQAAAHGIAKHILCLPREEQVATIDRLLELAPRETASALAKNIHHFSRAQRVEILKRAPRDVAPALIKNLKCFSAERQADTLQALLEEAPREAAPSIVEHLGVPKNENEEGILLSLLEKAPIETAPALAMKAQYWRGPKQVELVRQLLVINPKVAPILIDVLFTSHAHEKDNLKPILGLLLELAPKEASLSLAKNHYIKPEDEISFLRSLLTHDPQRVAPVLAKNLHDKNAKRLGSLLLELAPREAAVGIAKKIYCFREEEQAGTLQVLLRIDPKKVALTVAETLRCHHTKLSSKEAQRMLIETEREQLRQAEDRNPTLYDGIEGNEFFQEPFRRKPLFYLKNSVIEGSEIVLLGRNLVNKAILRIIPGHAFISWVEAYGQVETWKKAGFNYVPIEPIIRAHADKDGQNIRVYAGVLGVSAHQYLEMQCSVKHRAHVQKQIDRIRDTLVGMGIRHEDLMYARNFCVLHERTAKGEIDWNQPPRVYCIDFDQAISKLGLWGEVIDSMRDSDDLYWADSKE